MAANGKYQFGGGRARTSHKRDRAQLEFDDMLIEDYLDIEAPTRSGAETAPVRFGAKELADFLDDSTIAAALIRGETFEADEEAAPLTVGELLDGELFDGLEALPGRELESDAGAAEEATDAAFEVPVIRPTIRAAAEPAIPAPPFASDDGSREFTFKGLLRGFAFGAVAATVVLTLLRWVL